MNIEQRRAYKANSSRKDGKHTDHFPILHLAGPISRVIYWQFCSDGRLEYHDVADEMLRSLFRSIFTDGNYGMSF